MEIFSHILWPMMLFRNKLWRDEALFFAVLPDISFLFIMLFVLVGTPMDIGWHQAMYRMPDIYRQFYFFMHSFVALALVGGFIWLLRPKLLPALSGWFLHICMDIPMHDGEFATRFLYPIFPDVYVSGMSWTDSRVMAITYLMFINFTAYSLWRERKRHRMGQDWKTDWVDRLNSAGDALISNHIIPASDAARCHIRGALGKLPRKDKNGAGEGEDKPSRTLFSQKTGRGLFQNGKGLL